MSEKPLRVRIVNAAHFTTRVSFTITMNTGVTQVKYEDVLKSNATGTFVFFLATSILELLQVEQQMQVLWYRVSVFSTSVSS